MSYQSGDPTGGAVPPLSDQALFAADRLTQFRDGPLYYGWLQATLGFTAGYAVDFVTIIVLYTIATALLWIWFRGTDKVAAGDAAVTPIAAETPLLEQA